MLIIGCRASASFTYDKTDFISYKPCQGKIQGLGEKQVIGKGRSCYTITYDDGKDVQLLISNTYHIPNIPARLLCPQQVAQQSRDPLTGDYATNLDFILAWDYNCKIIQYDKHNNLPVLFTTPGGFKASAYLAKNMDSFSSLYANRHSLLFSTPYSNAIPPTSEELTSTTETIQTNNINTSKKRKHQDT
eukprot:9345188-Ditylum_brightwellii.AAC.1